MRAAGAVVSGLLLAAAGGASAEPIFLSRQYARCTTCHFSPTGGGLLTPYGRSLSREELSTFGKSRGGSPGREHEFLYGAAGDALGDLSVGIDLRPAHLEVERAGVEEGRNFLMNAEVAAALRRGRWTAYGQLGRQPRGDDPRITSFEHWLAFQPSRVGARAGRFLPAYGVRLADHTSFNRATLGLDNDDQVYGLELSFTGDRHLVQATVGARADAERVFTAAGRWQVDVSPRAVVVGSGLFRGRSDGLPRTGAAGVALGIAPVSRVAIWAQADARFRSGDASDGTRAYTLLGDVSVEAYRGVWIRFSPQLQTAFADSSAGILRYAVGVNLLPRTHWNVSVNWYRDRDRLSGGTAETVLAQVHLYL